MLESTYKEDPCRRLARKDFPGCTYGGMGEAILQLMTLIDSRTPTLRLSQVCSVAKRERRRARAGSRGARAASNRQTAEIGRSKKTVKSPCDRISDLRKLFSSIGPSTKASTSGAG